MDSVPPLLPVDPTVDLPMKVLESKEVDLGDGSFEGKRESNIGTVVASATTMLACMHAFVEQVGM